MDIASLTNLEDFLDIKPVAKHIIATDENTTSATSSV